MYSLEILLLSIVASATVAALITYGFHSSSATKKQALKTEAELNETREAFEAYRKQVLEEFSETASKFKTLNTSYVDLHQQLARSANTLCGETAANTLLEAPNVQSTGDAELESAATMQPVEVEFESNTIPGAEASPVEEASPIEEASAIEKESPIGQTPEFTGHEDKPAQAFVKH